MRVALISDLHANRPSVEAVLDDARAQGADRVVCLGDVVDLGPSPSETIALVRARCDVVIGGNHDPLDEHPETPFLRDIETWTGEALSDEERRWLDGLPDAATLDVAGYSVLCVHGSPRARTDNVLTSTPRAELDAWVSGHDFDVMACGHTHVQLLRRMGRRVVVNVGSVGLPFENPPGPSPPTILPWAEYGLLSATEGGLTVELRRIPIDLDEVRRQARLSGMPHAEQWVAQWA